MITGYRELTEEETHNINQVKEAAISMGKLIESFTDWDGADQRWVSIAKTDLQKGFMALTRAIAKPTTF
jgi:hypothetical protein